MTALDGGTQDEADEYLPPLLAPADNRRSRLNSSESWGSSVMPAALPFFQQHRVQAGQSVTTRDRSKVRQRDILKAQTDDEVSPLPVVGAGLESWLQSQSYLAPPPASSGRGDARHQTSQFTSFAPPGRVRRRVESDAGSAAGEGSLGGWSNGVMSATGRRRVMGKGSGRDAARPVRPGLPLWEGEPGLVEQEEPQSSGNGNGDRGAGASLPRDASVSSNLSSVLQWRDSSAIPSSARNRDLHQGPQPRKGLGLGPTSGGGSLKAPSLTGSVLPSSASRQSLRPLDLGQSRFVQEAKKRSEATPLRTFVRGMMKERLSFSALVSIGLCVLLLVKWVVAAGGWSGKVRAGWQTVRCWMSLTANLPLAEWYVFDVDHQSLNRPPLAGYLSRLFGSL